MSTKTIAVAAAAIVAMNLHSSDAAEKPDHHLAEARRLLRQVPLIDGHNDVPWQYRKHSNDFSALDLAQDTSALKPPMHTDIARLRAGYVGGQFWSVYVPTKLSGADAVQATIEQIDVVHQMCARYPGYNFCQNKGYPTPQHKQLLRERGPCPIHRHSYAPVAQYAFRW